MSKKQKLKDILSVSSTEIEKQDFDFRIDQAKINSGHEILDMKKEVSKQEKMILSVMRQSTFSLSAVYAANTTLELMQRKLDALIELEKDLF